MIATKQQEREALQKIRDIVSSLGEDSYLAMSFQGCFEDAEFNIENDWAGSYFQRWQEAQNNAKDLETANQEIQKKLENEMLELDNCKNQLQIAVTKMDQQAKKCMELHDAKTSAEEKINNLEGELHWEKMRVMELKAKLYDYMMTEKENGKC